MRRNNKLVLMIFLFFSVITSNASSAPKSAWECAQSVIESGDKLLQGCEDTSLSISQTNDDQVKKPAYDIDKLSTTDASQIVTVLPEVPTMVDLSSSDVNRLICPEGTEAKDITTDVVFSREKGVIAKVVGRNVFIKFKIQKKGNQEIYSTTPSEMYVICGDVVYNIIAIPKRIPAKTVNLSLNINKIKKNISTYGSLPFEKKVLALIRTVYREDIPETFTVIVENKKIDIYRDIDLTLARTIVVEGEGLRLKEYIVSIKGDKQEISFKEKDFLNTEVTTRPVAISLSKLSIKKGESAKVFIVEQGGIHDR